MLVLLHIAAPAGDELLTPQAHRRRTTAADRARRTRSKAPQAAQQQAAQHARTNRREAQGCGLGYPHERGGLLPLLRSRSRSSRCCTSSSTSPTTAAAVCDEREEDPPTRERLRGQGRWRRRAPQQRRSSSGSSAAAAPSQQQIPLPPTTIDYDHRLPHRRPPTLRSVSQRPPVLRRGHRALRCACEIRPKNSSGRMGVWQQEEGRRQQRSVR